MNPADPSNLLTTTAEAARTYIAKGIAVIPIGFGTKGKLPKGWQNLRIRDSEVSEYFEEPSNIGILNGEPSNELVDVDLDCVEAVRAAEHLLPQTSAIFGRGSRPRSHWLYRASDGIRTRQYRTPGEVSVNEGDSPEKCMICEVRSTGTQTLAPPSQHPSGEPVRWDCDGEPALVSREELLRSTAAVAVCAAVAQNWPGEGSRHDFALALAGFLLVLGCPPETCEELVRVAAISAQDPEVEDRIRAATTTCDRHERGETTTGRKRMIELCGRQGAALADAIEQWLTSDRPNTRGLVQVEEIGNWSTLATESETASELTPFPIDALPKVLADVAREVSRSVQVAVDAAGMLAIGVATSALAGGCWVRIGQSHEEPLCLWIVVVLPSGERKTATISTLQRPLDDWERSVMANYRLAHDLAREKIESHEARLRKLRERAADPKTTNRESFEKERDELAKNRPTVPSSPALIIQDITPEALAKKLEEQGGRAALISDEGGVFGMLDGRYSAGGLTNLDVHLKAHSGSQIKVERVNRVANVINKPVLSIVVTVQPIVLDGLQEQSRLRGSGVLARFLYCFPASRVGFRSYSDNDIAPDVRRNYETTIKRLLEFQGAAAQKHPRTIRIEGEALQLWKSFHDEIESLMREDSILEDLRDWGSKLPGAVARMAAVFHLVMETDENKSDRILAECVNQAISIARYLVPHARRAFHMLGGDQHEALARRLVRWIQKKGVSEFRLRELKQAHRSMPDNDVERAVCLLENRGYIRSIPQHAGVGRPSRRFKVHPELLNGPQSAQNPQNHSSRTMDGTTDEGIEGSEAASGTVDAQGDPHRPPPPESQIGGRRSTAKADGIESHVSDLRRRYAAMPALRDHQGTEIEFDALFDEVTGCDPVTTTPTIAQLDHMEAVIIQLESTRVAS